MSRARTSRAPAGRGSSATPARAGAGAPQGAAVTLAFPAENEHHPVSGTADEVRTADLAPGNVLDIGAESFPGADGLSMAGWGGGVRIRAVLDTVMDPEIPVLSVVDLGIVRHLRVAADGVEVGVTPTYSGCPATEVIRENIRAALRAAGYPDARVVEELSPPWTSDWISAAGREKLRRYGIAPPQRAVSDPRALRARPPVACPRCGSRDTERVSEFGSTPCKAHYRCASCAEPFDYFKCL